MAIYNYAWKEKRAIISVLACLHDHFNRGRLSIEAFSNQSKVIKKLSNSLFT